MYRKLVLLSLAALSLCGIVAFVSGCNHDPSDGDDHYIAVFDTYSAYDCGGHFSE